MILQYSPTLIKSDATWQAGHHTVLSVTQLGKLVTTHSWEWRSLACWSPQSWEWRSVACWSPQSTGPVTNPVLRNVFRLADNMSSAVRTICVLQCGQHVLCRADNMSSAVRTTRILPGGWHVFGRADNMSSAMRTTCLLLFGQHVSSRADNMFLPCGHVFCRADVCSAVRTTCVLPCGQHVFCRADNMSSAVRTTCALPCDNMCSAMRTTYGQDEYLCTLFIS